MTDTTPCLLRDRNTENVNQKPEFSEALANALACYRDGLDPSLIELPETAVFPHLIPAQPTTARKSRCTGILLGRPAPRFVKRGRTVRYRLQDILNWLSDGVAYGNTAEAAIAWRASPDISPAPRRWPAE